MQDSGTQPETPQIVIIVKNASTLGTLKDRDKENSEMEEFQAFKRYKAMKKRCEEKEKQERQKCENDQDYVSVWSDQSSGSTQELNRDKDEDRMEENKRKKLTSQRMKHTHEYHKDFGGLNFRSLFTDEINNTPILIRLKGPRVNSYDGIGNPDDHVSNFQWTVKMILMDPKLWSMYFVGTIDG